MKVKEKRWIRVRIYVVALLFLGGMTAILMRAYQLQILERDRLASIALAGYRGIIKLPPKRGIIYDRKGHEMAVSVELSSIYAHPNQVENKSLVAGRLSRILELKQDDILKLLQSGRPFVWIVRKTSPDKANQVQALKLDGIGSTTETKRFYPGKEIAAQLIGFAGEDNQGLEGIEKKYDRILKGPDYSLIQMRDALRRPFYISRPIADGHEMHDLFLTIDKDIQYKTEQYLKEVVEKTRAKSGHCIMVNPETGEIIAMAVAPLFNPNIFEKCKPSQWRNVAITDWYEPGSTMKTFVMAAAMDKGVATPETKFFCENGAYQIGSNVIHEHDAKKYGSLSVTEILTYSSNIGAVKIGQKLGYKKFHEYLKKFGFGDKTGIDMQGEREGYIRPARDAREIDKATVFFGQGVTVTSLQLVMALSAIANRGTLMRPYVVKAIKDQHGRVVKEFKPQIVRRVISPEVAQKAVQILETVVGETGTAKQAAISGYKVAGKTGTAQKVDPRTKTYSKKAYVAIFAGFVPADDPKLAMVVVVDEPEGIPYGGVVSAPIFRQVGAWTLNHLRINPQLKMAAETALPPERSDEREDGPPVRPSQNEREVGLLPDFRGQTIREVLRESRSLGLKVVVEGTGFAVEQIPGPGYPLDRISMVKINFVPPM